MATDTERREVARRLRDMRLDPWDDAACEIAQCVGIACCNSECHGSDETPECTMVLAHRLADLIDPDTTTDTTKTPELTTKCDRDALLSLSEDVDGAADDSGGFEPLAGMLRDIARCIREACGEVVR